MLTFYLKIKSAAIIVRGVMSRTPAICAKKVIIYFLKAKLAPLVMKSIKKGKLVNART